MAKKQSKKKSEPKAKRKRGKSTRVTAMEANAQRSPLLSRLWAAMKHKHILPRQLSEKAGLSMSYVHDLFSGRTENPTVEKLEAIAHVLDINVAFLRYGDDHVPALPAAERAIGSMPILGVVETGAFRSIMQSELTVVRPLSPVYPHASHFVEMVNDDAMSAAKDGPFLPAMELLCVDMASANIEVESGKLYVVRRTLDGGKTYETILRRAMHYRGQTELLAESRRDETSGRKPVYQKIVVPGRLGTDQRADVYAFGLVYGTFREIK